MKNAWARLVALSFVFPFCFLLSCKKQPEKAAVPQGEIPPLVLEALNTRFPKAEIDKWTKEKEGDVVIYDFEFKQEGWKFEADIKEDGVLHNWEKAIEMKDLPEPVLKAVETKYPGSTIKEVMKITAVQDGKEVLEGYEVVLETAAKNEAEVMVDPGGRILEDTGEKK